MENPKSSTSAHPMQRQLANLKLVSRLLGHELHAQTGQKAVTLSRDELQEIQVTIDLFIEEVSRWQGGASSAGIAAVAETRMVGNRG